MYHAKLSFPVLDNDALDADAVSDVINSLLGSLRQNGQIYGREWGITLSDTAYETVVLIPDQDAFDPKYHNRYVQKYLSELAAAFLGSMQVALLGEDIDSIDPCTCSLRASYILKTSYSTLQSPLRCGDCYDPVPLYRIPPTYDNDEYYDIICWQSDYQNCDHLQMNCTVLERAALQQLYRFDSALSKEGLAICNKIHSLTGLPVYYHLFRYNARSRKQELERKCPSCNGEWRLDTQWHIFDYKCDKCHLLSNIAYNFTS